jgi:hypothetical protein
MCIELTGSLAVAGFVISSVEHTRSFRETEDLRFCSFRHFMTLYHLQIFVLSHKHVYNPLLVTGVLRVGLSEFDSSLSLWPL